MKVWIARDGLFIMWDDGNQVRYFFDDKWHLMAENMMTIEIGNWVILK